MIRGVRGTLGLIMRQKVIRSKKIKYMWLGSVGA